MSCKSEKENNLIIVEETIDLDSIPSGSGISIVNDSVFIIGDDAPWLFQLPLSLQAGKRYKMIEDFEAEGRIPKAIKPDFECMAEFVDGSDPYLLIFGSGAQSPERDILLRVNCNHPEEHREYSLTTFYNHLLKNEGTGRETLNMEGAIVHNGKLYLFNRATNRIIKTDLEEFLSYLEQAEEKELPDYEEISFELPTFNGVPAGFSGAAILPGSTKILFTATLEATENWIADGDIMGSYIGILDIEDLEKGEVEKIVLVKDQEGQPTKDKLESLAVMERSTDNSLKVLAIADNDNGTSRLLKIKIIEKFFDEKE